MIENLFVRETKDFEKINKLLLKAIDVTKEMPNYIFKKNYRFLRFIYDYDSFTAEFAIILKKFTTTSLDDNFYLAVLKPNPKEYFYKHFGYYNYGVFPYNVSTDEYTKFITHSPDDSPADAILYNSNYICWLSGSLNWVIYLDREFEICVLAYNDDRYNKILVNSGVIYFDSIQKALDHNITVLDEIKVLLLSNYSV